MPLFPREAKMKVRVIVCGILLSMAASTAFCSGGSEKLVVATDPTWEPMEFIGTDGQPEGYDVDLMRAVARAGGFELDLAAVEWSSMFAGLASKRYDAVISAVTITDDRKQEMDFSDPYLKMDQYLVVDAENESVSGLADLAGKRVGALRGSRSLAVLENNREKYNLTVVPYSDFSEYVLDLHIGQLSAFVAEATIVLSMNRTPTYHGRFKIVGSPVATEYYGIAVRKGDSKSLTLINGGLRKVLASGESKALEERWLK